MNEARRVQALLGVLFVSVAALAIAVGIWLRLTPPPPPPPPQPPREAQLYIPQFDARGEVSYLRKRVPIRNPADAYREAYELLIRESKVFPKGTRLLEARVRNGTLQLNFSEELISNFEGGASWETALVNAITSTAASFPEVQRVQILVQGKPVETIGGHVDLSQALPVSP